MASLFQIVYTSMAKTLFSRPELLALLEGSFARNARAGITGLLLYRDGAFMQALEGEAAAVVKLFAKIRRDPRHYHVVPLLHEPIKERNFPNSAMGFLDLDSPEVRNRPGYSDFLNTPLDSDLLFKDIPQCKRLLLLFKENVR